MKVALYTLGCKVNQYETQALESELVARGHELTDFDSAADAYVINTCTVTAVSDKKSRQAIRRARKTGAVVAVCGCYAQTDPEAVKALGVDLVAGTGQRKDFVSLLEQAAADRNAPLMQVDNSMKRREFEFLPAGSLSGRTRAMLKVQDGCVNFCSYCIIPYARGPVRSLSIADAVAETSRLRDEGYKELVITGIEISSYGVDFRDGTTLADLIEAICPVAGDMRIRLGSLEPRTITREFCRRISKFENLCPQFHPALQSGCDETLSRMRRKYDTARFYESVELLREFFPGCAITTDMITGFPGETEEEFSKTLAFIEKCNFASMHIFPYSRRDGTPAASMPDQVQKSVKEERAARAGKLAAEMKANYLSSCVGKVFDVLFERQENGVFRGHAPNYCEVRAVSGTDLRGKTVPVTVTEAKDGCLIGTENL